jgi:hypothetical protein
LKLWRCGDQGFFFFQFCEVGGLVNYHPQEDLGTFGYRSKRSRFFFVKPRYIYWQICKNLWVEIWEFQLFFPLKKWWLWAIFSPKKSFPQVVGPFFWSLNGWNFATKKNSGEKKYVIWGKCQTNANQCI